MSAMVGQPHRHAAKTDHALVQPNQRRAALAQGRVAGGPEHHALAGERQLAQTSRLTAWVRIANPP